MNIIHNEVKANPVLERKFSNTCTNQKKQTIWLGITEKVNAVGNTRRTVNEVRDKWRNMCRDAKQKFAEHRRESKRTGGGPPPTPLSQSVTDIVEMYKDCSSFVGIPGGIKTSISIETDTCLTTGSEDSQTPAFGLTIIEVPAEELSNSSKVSNLYQ